MRGKWEVITVQSSDSRPAMVLSSAIETDGSGKTCVDRKEKSGREENTVQRVPQAPRPSNTDVTRECTAHWAWKHCLTYF